jgi:single-stranded-DNA-specific exonuclease
MCSFPVDKVLIEKYANDFSIPRELATIVARRYPEYSGAQRYLFPRVEQLHDPASMPDIKVAVDKIIETVKRGDGILIYTHDDVDGYTSAAVVYKALHDITRNSDGVYVYPIVRERDGYVLNPQVLRTYRDKGVRLLLTVDFGISNKDNFRIAEKEALNAVICDHHETNLDNFPNPAVNPKRPDSKYPFRELAGVGVAFKLAQFLYQEFFGMSANEFYSLRKNFFPIVCIGTFSDRVALREENRVFCVHGMQLMQETEEAWAVFLRQSGEVDINRLHREVLSTLGSAAYVDPRLGIEFFIHEEIDKVVECYNTLRETDQRRRQEIDSLFSEVVSSAAVTSELVLSVIPLSKQHYLGSVAARLREYFKRNSIIIGVKDNKCIGELRSCDLDLYRLLYDMRDFFLDFGGHKKAAGFSMDRRNLEPFLDGLQSYLRNRSVDIQNACDLSDSEPEALLRKSDIGMLDRLVPFGEGNPAPILTDGVSKYTVDNMLNIIEKV